MHSPIACTQEKLTAQPALRPLAIVEDDPHVCALLGDMLCGSGVVVEFFARGASLLDSASTERFGAILLDLSLPDMDGFEVLDRLARTQGGTPVVLMSGHDAVILDAARLYGSGIGLTMRQPLAKPFTRAALLGAIGLPSGA